MSVPFRTADVVTWTGGRLVSGDADHVFRGAGIDTRTIAKDELFVAIRGERHDAHAFLDRAVEAGATGLLVDEAFVASGVPAPDVVIVAVADTTRALGALAAGHRSGFAGPVVAITGSNGKTTTKEMCHAILSVRGPTLKNPGNLNNEFGLPLTLLSREPEHVAAVVELGMNHRGEIARLTAIARPDVGIVTNVGTAHIEFLGSRENIALEKGDLVAGLDPAGVAVLNADDPLVESQAERVRARIVRFGLAPHADVRARDVRFEPEGRFAFTLCSNAGEVPVRIAGLAETTVVNALAAAAGALAAGATPEQIAEGLAHFEGVPGRMRCRLHATGARIIDDTYNANPQSVRSALESLARLEDGGRTIAVIGDMGELGETADEAHREVGRLAARLGIDHLLAIGERAALVIEGAREGGMGPSRAQVSASHEEAGAALRTALGPRDWVLVKGSRAMRMERVVETLLDGENA
jgi:UDP-N-acetylmuramoyl-tripeptide--D-alanyl-D-alanine ligase